MTQHKTWRLDRYSHILFRSEIGAHILSGNVFDPRAMKELFPDDDWIEAFEEDQGTHATPVSKDEFLVLTEKSSFTVPHMLLPP